MQIIQHNSDSKQAHLPTMVIDRILTICYSQLFVRITALLADFFSLLHEEEQEGGRGSYFHCSTTIK